MEREEEEEDAERKRSDVAFAQVNFPDSLLWNEVDDQSDPLHLIPRSLRALFVL